MAVSLSTNGSLPKTKTVTAATSLSFAGGPFSTTPGTCAMIVLLINSTTVTGSVSGYTLVLRSTIGTSMTMEIWSATGSTFPTGSTAPTVTFSGSCNANGWYHVFLGTAASNPITAVANTSGAATNNTTSTAGAVVTTPQGGFIMHALGVNNSTATLTTTAETPPYYQAVGASISQSGLVLTVTKNAFDPLVPGAARPSGASQQIGRSFSSTATHDFLEVGIVVTPASWIPVLADETLLYGDTGVVLNANSATPPVFDLTNLSGFDTGSISFNEEDRDGAHGGFGFGQYLGGRTIVIEGTLYASSVSSLDDQLALLRDNFFPRSTPQPLYFKLTGKNQRQFNCVPMSGVKYDYTKERSSLSADFQVQLYASDPFAYEPITWYGGALDNTGTQEYYPYIGFYIGPGDNGAGQTFTWANYDGSKSVVISSNGLPAGPYILDQATRRLYNIATNVDYSTALTTRNWWTRPPNSQVPSNAIGETFTRPSIINLLPVAVYPKAAYR